MDCAILVISPLTLVSILATELAWKTPFRGSGARLFQRCLYDMNNSRSNKLFANFLALIQSSGFGKSKLVDEVAKLIFTIPFCFRTELDTTG